ncbi:hypothetical protein JYU34_005791 [Plutella xylostella]|uniref:Cap-specific mRNA (nucleoside-2'-O-)-methyltransferase 1 n=1 Tax=Plutella xylostella TaxID=51655 RepID=A0ABQ7QU53_PLUXY|nr:hypothetical protein JYU34_005791 [Plutella xylostella]
MSLSDGGEDDFSSDESPVPAKRPRTNTLGASSTTSFSSVPQESDDEVPAANNGFGSAELKDTNTLSTQPSMRLSRSSSESSTDSFRPGFEEHDVDSADERRPQFQTGSENDNDNADGADINGGYSEKAKRMMSQMGFKPGRGLGKFEHGRTEPVEASTQKGRRGLGLKPSIVGTVPQDFKWSPDDEKPEVKEEVLWIPTAPKEPFTGDVLEEWLQKGPKKLTIEDETDFVDEQILKGVLNAKTIFDSLDDEDLRNARFRSNPYETIGSVIFLNRAAVKMANIDAAFDFMFTKPTKKENGESALSKKEILYFADVCAGPGGFSEYVLYRKGWRSKGFGFTLKGSNDFKLSDFYAGTAETFNPYYGVEGDGNIFNPANLTSLKDHVLKHTEDKGVHFLMADGGFSVEGNENIQEILSKQLYLCQCLAALMLVRTGGHFVVKLFDVFTPFSVGLIYIMYHCFEQVCIMKPVTSRPANSERYLVCKWKRSGTEPCERHLFSVNAGMWTERGATHVLELVPTAVLQADTEFYQYIYTSNCKLGDKQIKNLLKIAQFSKDKNLKDPTQTEIREQCLRLWQLPDEVRTQPERLTPDDTLVKILDTIKPRPQHASSPITFKSSVLGKREYLNSAIDLKIFKSVYDWHFVFLESGRNSPDLKFFIGCGGKQVYQLRGIKWEIASDLHITMPPKTLVFGEVVKEYRGQGNQQIYSKALHVIDAIMLGGIDISHLPLTERLNQCSLFCAALHKPFDEHAVPLRCKRLLQLEHFPAAVADLEYRAMKRIRKAVTVAVPDRNHGEERFHIVGSVFFIKEIKEPWESRMSKKSGHKYYFGFGKDKKPRSEYYIPEEARLDMTSAFLCSAQWPWEPASAVLDGLRHDGLTRAELETYIKHNINR